jgi:hypothetical protein
VQLRINLLYVSRPESKRRSVGPIEEGTGGSRCTAKLDRLVACGRGRVDSVLPQIEGFRVDKDFKPRAQGRIKTYDRVRRYLSRTSSAQVLIQYQPQCPWLKPWRITLIADDDLGLTPQEIENAIRDCLDHRVTLVELALDFNAAAGIDEKFVRKYGRFGKSRLQLGRAGQFRFGSRASPKLVRFYRKEEINCFRVEIEAHAALLRKYSISQVSDLGTLAMKLSPAHIKFVRLRWEGLQAHLIRKFGRDGGGMYEEARRRSKISLGKALRYLAQNGVVNPHRFLGSLKLNRDVREALRRWAEAFTPDQDRL